VFHLRRSVRGSEPSDAVSDPKILKGGGKTFYQPRPHLSQMHTTICRPFTRKRAAFWRGKNWANRGRPPPPPPFESATVSMSSSKTDCNATLSLLPMAPERILKWGEAPVRSKSGAPIGRQAPEKIFLVAPLHFLVLKAQLVVSVSAFVMVSTVWSVSCLLFFYSQWPPCPAICKSGSRALWSRRHCLLLYWTHVTSWLSGLSVSLEWSEIAVRWTSPGKPHFNDYCLLALKFC